MQHHTRNPCSRHTDTEKTSYLKYSSKCRLTACSITTVHDVITRSDRSGSKIYKQHIFSIMHCFRSQPKQTIQRLIQDQADQNNTKSNCRTQDRKSLDILVSLHMVSCPDFFSYYNGTCVCQTSKECKYKTFQYTKSRHSSNCRFRLSPNDNIDQHLSNSVKQLITDNRKAFLHIRAGKSFPVEHCF